MVYSVLEKHNTPAYTKYKYLVARSRTDCHWPDSWLLANYSQRRSCVCCHVILIVVSTAPVSKEILIRSRAREILDCFVCMFVATRSHDKIQVFAFVMSSTDSGHYTPARRPVTATRPTNIYE